jgi:hypothetical protein
MALEDPDDAGRGRDGSAMLRQNVIKQQRALGAISSAIRAWPRAMCTLAFRGARDMLV